jgi:hypothetical protein
VVVRLLRVEERRAGVFQAAWFLHRCGVASKLWPNKSRPAPRVTPCHFYRNLHQSLPALNAGRLKAPARSPWRICLVRKSGLHPRKSMHFSETMSWEVWGRVGFGGKSKSRTTLLVVCCEVRLFGCEWELSGPWEINPPQLSYVVLQVVFEALLPSSPRHTPGVLLNIGKYIGQE